MNSITPFQPTRQEIARQESLANRLCERTPEENLENMAVIAKARGLGMYLAADTRTKPDGGWYSMKVPRFAVDASNEARKEVLGVFRDMLTPASEGMIITWLSKLAIKTSKKSVGAKDQAVELKEYAADLQGFPADVVHYALQAKHYRWWPPVGDIIKICDEQVADRVAVVNKLQALIIRHDEDGDKPVTQDASDETAKKTESDFLAIDEILKNAGFTPKVAWTEDHNIYAKGD